MSERKQKIFDAGLNILVGVMIIAPICVAGSFLLVRGDPEPLRSQAFACQYPTRPLVNGQCDNSDPCDPATVKDPGLGGNCAKSPEPATEEFEQPILGGK